MIFRLTTRTILARPARFAILAGGFGIGVGVMAALLGVGEVILEQALSPALVGGGDVQVFSLGKIQNTRVVLDQFPDDGTLLAASPALRGPLFLVDATGATVKVDARAGIPSLERALGDIETAGVEAWQDTESDRVWQDVSPAELLRGMDRFHELPQQLKRQSSWAEWLYFNGRSEGVSFYLTFLVGPPTREGYRGAGVRMQVERQGQRKAYAASTEVGAEEVLATAPDLTLGPSRVRLEGMRYLIDVELVADDGEHLSGHLEIEAVHGRSLPPFTLHGARGWQTGYTVPVLSGSLVGELKIGDESLELDGTGYHDHNWGSWEGVTWNWGQVSHGDVSVLYGRVRPAPEDASAENMPSVLALLGEEGILGITMSAVIEEEDGTDGLPRRVTVRGRGEDLDLEMVFRVEEIVPNRPAFLKGAADGPALLQMQGEWTVTGMAGGKALSFTAEGSAETFR